MYRTENKHFNIQSTNSKNVKFKKCKMKLLTIIFNWRGQQNATAAWIRNTDKNSWLTGFNQTWQTAQMKKKKKIKMDWNI